MSKRILIVEDEFIVANDLANILRQEGYEISGIADSYDRAVKQIAVSKPHLALLDIRLNGELTGIDVARMLNSLGIPFIYISANSNKAILEEAKPTRPYGFLIKPFRAKDVLIALEIASYHSEHSSNLDLLLQHNLDNELRGLLVQNDTTPDKFIALARAFQPYISFDLLEISHDILGDTQKTIACFRTGLNEYQSLGLQELANMTATDVMTLRKRHTDSHLESQPALMTGNDLNRSFPGNPFRQLLVSAFRFKSLMTLPVNLGDRQVGLNFYHKNEEHFIARELQALQLVIPTLRQILLQMADSNHRATASNPQMANRKMPSAQVPKNFGGIVGSSPALLTIFDQLQKVAPMDTSVLILGESGTGKELVAKCIHNLSRRKDKPFVVVNCGALPDNLIESILFGHEKGAFTGALEMRIGKFEQANGGTIFLDEVGEMPLALQVRLLRVLQEKEIERIGSTKSQQLDIRIVAATNKNLDKEVEEGRFRLDLYYRLNVFPIRVPALRERKEDIPLLTQHFVSKFCSQSGMPELAINEFVLASLMNYEWPGNIRELENCIEKACLLSEGRVIEDVYLPFIKSDNIEPGWNMDQVKSIHEMERDYILHILRKCKGKVFGKNGAAELLKVPTSTLNSKIRKLGISKREINL